MRTSPPLAASSRSQSEPPIRRFQVERPRFPQAGPFPLSGAARRPAEVAFAPMPVGAAIFDLDRTLLGGASGPVLSDAMRAAGVLSSRTLPGERFVYGVFNAFGETLPGMALARQAASLAKGRSQQAVQTAAVAASAVLAGMIQPYAGRLFEEHRAAGRRLVLATTTPFDLVKPLADALGFDDVVATRYGVNADGTYDGSVAGPFVWSMGKLDAVRQWAARAGVDLRESYFYSDSVYDLPLLNAVGHPTVVNPDPRLLVVAALRRWPVLNLDVPPGVPKLPLLGLEPQRITMLFSRPELFPYARFDVTGTDHIPREGPAIIVANHRSYFDVAAMSLAIARSGRTIRFLGKKEVFDAPVVGQLATAMGGIRVERGTGSDEPLQAAADALSVGELVAIMPQGTIPRGPAFFDPELKGRWGAARLAAMTKAPVIPIGLWGTEKVWPRNSRLPNIVNVTSPPLVTVRVGEAVPLLYRSPGKDTERIMQAIMDLLPAESRERREPTPEELARALPPGYKGEPEHEVERRPGTD
jgi:putative phosphoserine phosphatase / 1-acylglycerol-3-phosphate O-acyltransferase